MLVGGRFRRRIPVLLSRLANLDDARVKMGLLVVRPGLARIDHIDFMVCPLGDAFAAQPIGYKPPSLRSEAVHDRAMVKCEIRAVSNEDCVAEIMLPEVIEADENERARGQAKIYVGG